MNVSWPTKARDLQVAEQIIEQYARLHNTESLGLFELVVDREEKRMNFQLSHWVIALAEHFNSLYGAEKGDIVTRKVISSCLTNGQTIH